MKDYSQNGEQRDRESPAPEEAQNMTSVTVLVCGDRNWSDHKTMFDRLASLSPTTIIEGGCRGADKMAGKWATVAGVNLYEVQAEWDLYGKRAGPIRNRKMLDMGPDLVLAFHNDYENSRGTRDCVEEAKRRGIPTEIVQSQGSRK